MSFPKFNTATLDLSYFVFITVETIFLMLKKVKRINRSLGKVFKEVVENFVIHYVHKSSPT